MQIKSSKNIFCLLSITIVVLMCGCSTVMNSHLQKEPMMKEYLEGENNKVADRIDEKLTPQAELSFFKKANSVIDTGDEVMWQLEAGTMSLYLKNYQDSIKHFSRAERLIAEYDDRAVVSIKDGTEEGASLMTNLNALPYRGFCRDRIALSIYKSLAYLGEGNESAFRAQLRRMRDEQKKVMEDYQKFFDAEAAEVKAAKEKNPEVAEDVESETSEDDISDNPENQEFCNGLREVKEIANKGYGGFLNPMAIFFSGLGAMRDGNFENAKIDFQRLYEAMPKNPMIKQYYVSVLNETRRSIPAELKNVKPFDFSLDRDCVYIIFANGRGASFKQIAVYFPIMTAWPMCEFYTTPYNFLDVNANGKIYKTTTLADMDGIIAQEFDERLPAMITRIVLSTALKEAAKYAATYAAAKENILVGAGVYIGSSIYTVAMNTADTRSWELLPKEFQLTQFPMPKDRKITIDFNGSGHNIEDINLPHDCGSAIILVNAPSEKNINYHVFPLK